MLVAFYSQCRPHLVNDKKEFSELAQSSSSARIAAERCNQFCQPVLCTSFPVLTFTSFFSVVHKELRTFFKTKLQTVALRVERTGFPADALLFAGTRPLAAVGCGDGTTAS